MNFHLKLLSKVIDVNQYPVIKLIIGNNLSHHEYRELIHLLETLNTQYEIQKGEGLLDFTALLIHFAGMLNSRLEPDETIIALKKEGYYPSLMSEFIKVLKVNGLMKVTG